MHLSYTAHTSHLYLSCLGSASFARPGVNRPREPRSGARFAPLPRRPNLHKTTSPTIPLVADFDNDGAPDIAIAPGAAHPPASNHDNSPCSVTTVPMMISAG